MTREKDSIDATDLKLLQLLQRDGRISNARLAEVIGLSQSACFQRIRRLEKKHYITSYSASISAAKICHTALTIFTLVKIESDEVHVVKEFETYARNNPAVLEWHATVGEHDYLLRFLVPTLEKYRQIVNEMMERNLKVKSFTSMVVHRSSSKPPDLLSLVSDSLKGK